MPIYEYRCRTCGEEFSRLFRSIRAAEGERRTCPACEGEDITRLISRVAVHTGSGEGSEGAEESPSEPGREAFGRKELNRAIRERGY
jgi:putative FmdB family regulatory protein